MKKNLIISLTFLTLVITACGGQPTQTQPGPVAPTQAATQPASVPTSANTTAAAPESVTAAPVVSTVSFSKDVMPIFANSCGDCHGGEQMKAGLDLTTYDSLMAGSSNGSVIVPGNSADSFLIQQVVNGKMPKRGPKLTAEQIKTISDWIDAGALNN